MQQDTPRRKSKPNLRLIREAIKTNPKDKGMSIEEIAEWLRTSHPTVYKGDDEEKLQNIVKSTLDQHAKRPLPEICGWSDNIWRLHETASSEANLDESIRKDAEGHAVTPSALVPSPAGGRTLRNGSAKSLKRRPTSFAYRC